MQPIAPTGTAGLMLRKIRFYQRATWSFLDPEEVARLVDAVLDPAATTTPPSFSFRALRLLAEAIEKFALRLLQDANLAALHGYVQHGKRHCSGGVNVTVHASDVALVASLYELLDQCSLAVWQSFSPIFPMFSEWGG